MPSSSTLVLSGELTFDHKGYRCRIWSSTLKLKYNYSFSKLDSSNEPATTGTFQLTARGAIQSVQSMVNRLVKANVSGSKP